MLIVFTGALAAPIARASDGSPPAEGSSEKTSWRPSVAYSNDKLRFAWDDELTLDLGGLFQGDGGYIQKNAPATPEGWDGEVRRARIQGSGLIKGRVFYKGEYDFVGDDGRAGELKKKYKDVYIEVQDVPYVGNITMGHFKEPYSLQYLIDAGNRIFMEEALSVAFTPGRNTGGMFSNTFFDDRVTVAVGAFSNCTNDSNFWGAGGQANLTGRVTWLPWYREGGRKLFHVGISATQQWRNDDDYVRFQQKPEYNMADIIADTGPIASESQVGGLGEFAINYGSLSAQLEMSFQYQNTPGPLNNHFKGAYVQTSYLLTGEHRPYDMKKGIFGRLHPDHPFNFKRGGWGAWEIGLRASYLDFHDYDVRGGYMNELGVALNWYLNSVLRIGVDYLHNHKNSHGNSSIFAIRTQIHF